MENKVIPITRNTADFALFSPEVRGKLETSIQPFTAVPQEVVQQVEQTLTVHLVSIARRFGESVAAGLIKSIRGGK